MTPPPPRDATVARFYDARFGLFIHYGLYSLIPGKEWVQLLDRMPVATYAKLADQFTAENFDAHAIARLAKDAGMRYINLTTRHHDSFCLWNTRTTDFNSTQAPECRRDLVYELADACRDEALDLCLYISHGRDWRHPHAPNNDQYGGCPRPEYDPPEPSYAYGEDHDLNQYIDYVDAQIRELLTQYGPIMAIWLDGIAVPLSPKDSAGQVIEGFDPRTDGDPFRCQQTYDLVHKLQPACMVSYKQGYLGTEDFFAPEHRAYNRFGEPFGPERPGEVCTTMTPGTWGYDQNRVGTHLDADAVWEKLVACAQGDCNLLLNTGPDPTGAIVPGEAQVLREVGERLAREGFPERMPSSQA